MAHASAAGGHDSPRRSENRLARCARGRLSQTAAWAAALTGAAALALTVPALAQQLPAPSSPYALSMPTAHQGPAPAAAQQPAPPPRPVEQLPAEAPMPRPANPFAEAHPRLSGLPAGVKPPVGTTPIPNKEEEQQRKKYDDRFVDPAYTIDLIVSRPRLWYLKDTPFRIQIGDEEIMSYTVIGDTPRVLSLLGRRVGVTVFNLWFGDRDDISKQTVLSYQVNVLPDPEAKERLERMYKALEDEINRAFPDAYVCLFLVGDKVVITGEVKDPIEATKILQIVRANAPGNRNRDQDYLGGDPRNRFARGGAVGGNIPVLQAGVSIPPYASEEDPQAALGLENYIIRSETNIVNMLRIPGEQQVMLKVVVAEVSRAAARSLGVDWSITNKSGIRVFAQETGNLARGAAAATTNAAAAASGVNLPAVLDNGRIPLAIEALRNVNLARSLAEPNLVTLNGRPATFRAGGEFPVPVVTGATATGLTGVSFVPFGVQLFFTPIVTDKDRVRLQLTAEVSTRDVAIGTQFGTGANTNTFVPGLNTRLITTTVEMREGQTLAIGGLLQTNLGADTARVPLFGDIPFGGQIFRLDRTQASESELVLLVTPELVHPMEPKEIPPLPGSDYFEPGDLEFYLHGKLESNRSYDYRSPVMDDIHRMAAYRHCELLYFVGPHGHTDNH